MVVSGILDNLKQYSQDSSARDSKKDETKRVFRFYLAATNEFTTMRLNTVANMI